MLRVLRRRGWLLPIVTLAVGACAYGVVRLRHVTYSAQAVAVVLGSNQLPPGEADHLAVTYAAMIPTDSATMNFVARRLRIPESEVTRHTTVLNNGVDALLRINFTASTAGEAVTGARSILGAVSRSHPVSPNIARGAIGAVISPGFASSSAGTTKYVVIGAILGVALAILLMSSWERVDPRIDDDEILSSEAGSPASTLDALSDRAISVLVERWQQLAGQVSIRVAVLPVGNRRRRQNIRRQAQAADVAERITSAAQGEDLAVPIVARAVDDLARHSRGTPGELELIAGPAPGEHSGGEAVATRSDLTVLVVVQGTPRRHVRAACKLLAKFDITPAWAILVRRRAGRKRSEQAGVRLSELDEMKHQDPVSIDR